MIKIICVGKLKEKYLKDMVNDYLERINKYHKLEIIEVNDCDICNEEKLILKHIKNEFVITLQIDGEILDSISLSKKLNDLFICGQSNVVFVIGGSDGIGGQLKKRSDYALSFSKLTFPHGLFRALLLEQIYRSLKIINNESYHK